ncbi:hypothetical protein GCM10029976_047830 [Kribbella albertanoniae]|uniref:Uncharacterized protein n=1 Tax=Kribbella albertanoniae TaxID=1266829 RepID=A0A4R4Q4J0_9ACTN|nr:hypothetical protein [Kribbella albertanoniae]TDC29743.1 hypothetical protein E1261_15120 [Kribbella albertanoniae]
MRLGRSKRRRFEFSTELASRLEGVVFRAIGQIVVDVSEESARVDWAATEAAAQSTLDAVAVPVTRACSPLSTHVAQLQLSAHLAKRRPVHGSAGTFMTAHCRITLSPEDERRTRIFYDTVRSEQLQVAIDRERLGYLREVLEDPKLARLWWLDRHEDQVAAMTWEEFDNTILAELASTDESVSRAERVARTITQVFEELASNQAKQTQFLELTEKVVKIMGWSQLSEEPEPPSE